MAYTTFIQTLIVSSIPFLSYIRNKYWGTWLAQSADHVTLDLRVVSLSLVLGVQIM